MGVGLKCVHNARIWSLNRMRALCSCIRGPGVRCRSHVRRGQRGSHVRRQQDACAWNVYRDDDARADGGGRGARRRCEAGAAHRPPSRAALAGVCRPRRRRWRRRRGSVPSVRPSKVCIMHCLVFKCVHYAVFACQKPNAVNKACSPGSGEASVRARITCSCRAFFGSV